MDWDLKMPPWDLAELEPNAEPNISSMIGPSHSLDCSVDLKLGGLGDLGSSQKWKDHQRISPSSLLKKARQTGNNSSQNVACLVDGCRSDLSNCREYHRRHKVCGMHSKTPVVLVGGQEQRFCQQCSRFHLLEEFDEVKRSCRKRLDAHNRRRRKPQPDSINSGSLFTNHQGNRFSSHPQLFATETSDTTWPIIIKTEDPLYSHHPPLHFHNFPSTFSRSFKESTKHFPFLQDSEPAICQPLLNSISSVESSSSNNSNKIFCKDSDCALSLLSSPPQSSAINVGHIISPTERAMPMGQPLISCSGGLGHQRFSCLGMEDENVGSNGVLVSDASDHEMNCHGLFGVGVEGSSEGAPQAHPFSWYGCQ